MLRDDSFQKRAIKMSRKRQGGKLVRPGSKKTKKAKVAVDQKTKEEEEVPLTRFQSESEDSDGDESQVGKVSKDSKTIQSKVNGQDFALRYV